MPIADPEELAARCKPIELLVLDVDGVLTDGVIAIDDEGVETKHFFVRDGSGVKLWKQAGKRAAILSGRWARLVDRRAAELGIEPVIQGRPRKLPPFLELIGELGLEPRQVCFVGDDLPDLPVLTADGLGLAACPADAIQEVREAVHFITIANGGRGAVREVIELLLKSQGAWQTALELYRIPPQEG